MGDKTHIRTDYPPEIIEDFITWFTDNGYSYDEVFKSSLKTQNYYMQRFLKQLKPKQKQLKLPL